MSNLPDLSGKVAVVTGANAGVGKATAAALISAGAQVIMACRSIERAEKAKAQITVDAKGSAEIMELDLSDLNSVNKFADAVLAKYQAIHILVNNGGLNAGTGYAGPKVTKQGYEICFGTNHLGHFMLIALLLDTLKAASSTHFQARIVNVCSCSIWSVKDLNFQKYHKGAAREQDLAYARSKLASTMVGVELARRLGNKGVLVYGAEPGFTDSEIWRDNPKMQKIAKILALTEAQGARTSVTAATCSDLQSGSYLSPFMLRKSWLFEASFKLFFPFIPLFTKPFFGCIEDSPPRMCYNQEEVGKLFQLSYQCCEESGFNLPTMQ